MSINKDRYNKNHDKYIKNDKIVDKDIYDHKSHDIYIKEDKCFDKDICYEYIEKDEIGDESHQDNHKKTQDYPHLEESKISVNCKLKVDFDTKNKMIYLYPGKSQYFTVDVSKSCGDVTIKYKGCYSSNGIHGNLGIYKIVQSGIFVQTYTKLNPRKNDFLNFTAIDQCTKECYDFVVVFSCNLCRYCY